MAKKKNNSLDKVGKFILAERTKQKLSLVQLSNKAFGNPYSATIISKIERGLYPNARFITIADLLLALGVEMM